MKKKLFVVGAVLTIAIPSFVAAEGIMSKQTGYNPEARFTLEGVEAVADCSGGGRMGSQFGRSGHQGKFGSSGQSHGQGEQFKLRSDELVKIAEKYSPNTAEEWKEEIAIHDELRAKWFSAEYEEAREKFMEERQAEVQKLRDQFRDGKITKEKMREKMFEKRGNKETRGLYQDLQAAAVNEDSAKIDQILGQMLNHLKDRNDDLRKRMEDTKN